MNPILSRDFKIPFAKIQASDITTAIPEVISLSQNKIDEIINNKDAATYENTIVALDDGLEPFNRAVTIAYHLSGVKNTTDIRKAFNEVLPQISEFSASLPLNQELWQRIKNFSNTDAAKALTGLEKRHLEKVLRGFLRSGADLSAIDRERIKEISIELSRLSNKFSENVLDSANSYELIVENEEDLSGLPKSVLELAKTAAKEKNIKGYRFNLQMPFYLPLIKYADNRKLRKNIHQAFANRASGGKFDNEDNINRILELRKEYAGILGYDNFVAYQLEERMLKTEASVRDFQEKLFAKTIDVWKNEIVELENIAKTKLGLEDFQAWDVAYVIEKLRQEKYNLDEQELRPYFPLPEVMKGLFTIANKLYGVKIQQVDNSEVWHKDVNYYDMTDRHGKHLGSFYADLFPREEKRSGAWMNAFIVGDPNLSKPHLGLIAANFNKAQNNEPALLTHDEVGTLFHEFGHLLHLLLSEVPIAALAGPKVAWDFVELPSQIMENWTFEKEALNIFAKHYKTNRPLPKELVDKLQESRKFMQAHYQMRQLSFGVVDIELHSTYDKNRDGNVVDYVAKMTERFAIKKEFAHNNHIKAFSHIFAGGYASGYYSYKWSEVLDADAFTRFKDEGIFNPKTGQSFLDDILSKGNSEEPEILFKNFMGREPSIESLLERNLSRV